MGISKSAVAVLVLGVCFDPRVAKADVTPEDEYMRRLQVHQTITPSGGAPFGEQINPYTGELGFRQTDLVFEGTGPTIRLARELDTAQHSDHATGPSDLGDWTLSIPRLETLTSGPSSTLPITNPGDYWYVGVEQSLARCTDFRRPRFSTNIFNASGIGWNGFTLVSEDGERHNVLARSAVNVRQPSMTSADGQPMVFPAVTLDSWQIGCLPHTSNGQAGEAFLAVSPDGTRYWLDYLVATRVPTIDYLIPGAPGPGNVRLQPRLEARMYVSRIEDRFGNFVLYHYTGDQLTSITASDGRSVSIAWRSDAPVIASITQQPGTTPARTWQYQYNSGKTQLTAVLLPDDTQWSYDLNGIRPVDQEPVSLLCGARSATGTSPETILSTVTAPSGLVGKFTVSGVGHARSYVPSTCPVYDPTNMEEITYENNPPFFRTNSLVRRELSGPGLATQVTTYAYQSVVGSAARDACAIAGTCADTVWVDVTDPAGNRTRHTYSNRWGVTEGKEISTNHYQGASTLLRTQTYAYAAADGGPWPATLGDILTGALSNHALQETWTPLRSKVIGQQGETFTWTATSFDAFARPLSVTRDSSLNAARSDVTAYHDNQADWVLGQVASTTVNGIVQSQTTYNAQDLPWKTYAFGKLQQTLVYYADGTLKTATDGNNHATTLSSWYRGVPRLITYADTTTQSAGVNAYGWITSVTDETDATTSYGHDVMGRVNKITYPPGDTPSWNVTNIAFVPVTSTEYGIAAGHWRQTVSTGNGRKITYYDALWRPLLTREYDAGNVAATDRYTATAYDPAGHANYSGYPVAVAPAMAAGAWSLPGVHSNFDALGRVTAVTQDSELGPLTTTTQYLTGFQRRTTDPRGNSTTAQFVAYDQPSFDQPTRIDAPENTRTTITRDVFGKPTAITRGATP